MVSCPSLETVLEGHTTNRTHHKRLKMQ
jgi:hypothetical protein